MRTSVLLLALLALLLCAQIQASSSSSSSSGSAEGNEVKKGAAKCAADKLQCIESCDKAKQADEKAHLAADQSKASQAISAETAKASSKEKKQDAQDAKRRGDLGKKLDAAKKQHKKAEDCASKKCIKPEMKDECAVSKCDSKFLELRATISQLTSLLEMEQTLLEMTAKTRVHTHFSAMLEQHAQVLGNHVVCTQTCEDNIKSCHAKVEDGLKAELKAIQGLKKADSAAAASSDSGSASEQDSSASGSSEEDSCGDSCDGKVTPTIVDALPGGSSGGKATGSGATGAAGGSITLPAPPTASALDIPGLMTETAKMNAKLAQEEAQALKLTHHLNKKQDELEDTMEWRSNAKSTRTTLENAMSGVQASIGKSKSSLTALRAQRDALQHRMQSDELELHLRMAKLSLTSLSQKSAGVSMDQQKLNKANTKVKTQVDDLHKRLSVAIGQFDQLAGGAKSSGSASM